MGSYTAEMAIHFQGLRNRFRPHVFAFPALAVCLDCGATHFVLNKKELMLLKEVRPATNERFSRSGPFVVPSVKRKLPSIKSVTACYFWQQTVEDAFKSPPASLAGKINTAQRAIASRLTSQNELDIKELLALEGALRSLEVLIAETNLQPELGEENENLG